MSDTSPAGQGLDGPSGEEILSDRFAQMVLQQANMAMMLLGTTPHPQTGKTVRDIDAARMFIDQLEMIEVKTKGNLCKEEQALLKQSLLSLHLAFVQAVESPPLSAPGPAAAPPPAPAESAGAAAGSAPAAETSAAEPDSKKKFSKKY